MQIAHRTIRVVQAQFTEGEWATIRGLVAEGLATVERVTPRMRAVASALDLALRDEPPREEEASADGPVSL